MSDFDFVVDIPPEPENQGEHDLSPFEELNKKKVPWDERLGVIKKQFPSVAKLDWYKVFTDDPVILGRLINDILKVDQAEPGKPGKRPAIDVKTAESRLRQMRGEDYTVMPFREAFKALCGNRSIRAVAHKTGMDRNYVHRLLQGDASPSGDQMAQIARSFGKDPGFFYEYRVAYIFGVMYYKLADFPETTVGFYRKLKGK